MPKTIEVGFVKICGVTSLIDAEAVRAKGASALGLIFADSPRRVTCDLARTISNALGGSILRGGVFRNNDDDFVRQCLSEVSVDFVQIHGTLSDELLDDLREKSLTVVKALNIDGPEFFDFDESKVDAVLVDGPRPGSGATHSWDALEQRSFAVPVIAAGGLDALNVTDLIRATKVAGVDCASGVERRPGEKDREKVAQFISNARRAFSTQGV